MDNDKVLRTYDEICNTALINLFGLSKNMKTINIELYDLNSYNSKYADQALSAIESMPQKQAEEIAGNYEKAWEYSNKNNANIGYKLAISYINSKQYVKALNICNEIKRKFKEYPIDELAIRAKNGLND